MQGLPTACRLLVSDSTWHSGSLTRLRAREGGAADPTIGPQRATWADHNHHAREPPPPSPSQFFLPRIPPRHAPPPHRSPSPPTASGAPPPARAWTAPSTAKDRGGPAVRRRPRRRPMPVTAVRAPPALGACGGRTGASGGRRVRPFADCGKLPARVRTAAVAAAARGAPQRGASRRRCVGGGGGASTVGRPPSRVGRPLAASQWGGHPRGGRIGRWRCQAAPGKYSRGGGDECLAIHGSMILHSSMHNASRSIPCIYAHEEWIFPAVLVFCEP